MKYGPPFQAPTSLVQSAQLRIATYEARSFLPQTPDRGGKALRNYERKPSHAKVLVPGILMTAIILAAIFLGAATAQADPANVSNQATLIRFSNRVSLGAAQHTQTQQDVERALTRFVQLRDYEYFFTSRSAVAPLMHFSAHFPGIVTSYSEPLPSFNCGRPAFPNRECHRGWPAR